MVTECPGTLKWCMVTMLRAVVLGAARVREPSVTLFMCTRRYRHAHGEQTSRGALTSWYCSISSCCVALLSHFRAGEYSCLLSPPLLPLACTHHSRTRRPPPASEVAHGRGLAGQNAAESATFGRASRPHRSLPLGPARLSGSSQACSVARSLETQPQPAKAASCGTARTTVSPCGGAVRRAGTPLRSARSDRRRAGVGCRVAARPRQRETSWQARGSGHTAAG